MAYTYNGLWWLPQNKGTKVYGTLYIDELNNIELSLIDNFIQHENYKNENYTIPLILGITDNGEKYTLYNNIVNKINFGSNRFNSISVTCNYAFKNAHFQDKDELNFIDLSCRFTHFEEWIWANSFDIRMDNENKKCEIEYKLPEVIRFNIDENYEFEIFASTKLPALMLVQNEASIKEKFYTRIRSNKEINFNELLNKLYQFQRLLSLAIGTDINMYDIYGHNNYAGSEAIHLIFSRRFSFKKDKEILPQRMLFNYRIVKDKFKDIAIQWYGLNKNFNPIIELYFEQRFNGNLTLQQKFLQLIQGIESYHRLNYKINNLEEHEIKLSKILESTPKEYSHWLNEKLKYSYEPTLRKRLKEINNDFHIMTKSDINKICITRNYLTHYDEELRKEALNGLNLYEINEKLQKLCITILLQKIGFTQNEVINILKL